MIKEKLGVFLAYLMQFLIFIFLIVAIIRMKIGVVFIAIIGLFITFIPLMLKRKWKVTLPWTLNLLITLSLFIYIGGVLFGWFHLFHPYYYDKISHLIASITVALLGFTSVLIIDWYTEVELTDKSILVFVVIFTLAVGAFWEILEFGADQILGTNSQYDGLSGSMFDLIFDLAGGIIAAIVASFRLKQGRRSILEKMFHKVKKKIE